MIILSSDYHSNIPQSGRISQGGPARFAERLSEYLVEKGHDWIGVASRQIQDASGPEYEVLHKSKHKKYYEWRFASARFTAVTQAKSVKSSRRLLKAEIDSLGELIASSKPDIIFLNGFSLFSWILMEAGHQCGVPMVMQHAGFFKKEIRMYAESFSPAGRRMLYNMEREITDLAQAEIFLNEWSKHVYNQTVRRVPSKQAHIIPLPYDHVSTPKKMAVSSSQKIYKIGMVARWDRIKNHEAVLNLANYAKKHALPWEFYSITTIPDSTARQDFKKAYAAAITVIPPKSSKDLRAFYRDMDTLILPSHFDVSPHVVMEALIEGVGTAISENVGWNSEYKKCGAADWIADYSKPAQVARKISNLLKKPDISALRKAILIDHDPKTIYRAYETLFIKTMRA